VTRIPGTRVWAVRNADDTTVYAFGFGIYLGDLPRPGWDADLTSPAHRAMCERAIRRGDADPIDCSAYYLAKVAAGDMTQIEADEIIARAENHRRAEQAKPMDQRIDELTRSLADNPKIRLDSGGVVWGCECWWGEADNDTPERYAKGRTIVTVPPPHPDDEES